MTYTKLVPFSCDTRKSMKVASWGLNEVLSVSIIQPLKCCMSPTDIQVGRADESDGSRIVQAEHAAGEIHDNPIGSFGRAWRHVDSGIHGPPPRLEPIILHRIAEHAGGA